MNVCPILVLSYTRSLSLTLTHVYCKCMDHAYYGRVLQCVAVCCSVLQCVAVCCSVLQVAVYCSVLQPFAVCCSVLQCVAVRCSGLYIP